MLIGFYNWAIDGQKLQNGVGQNKLFQFCCAFSTKGEIVATYNTLCTWRHSASSLSWGPEEELYALQVDSTMNYTNNVWAWKGLPLARTVGVYVPFGPPLIEELRRLKSAHLDLATLADLVN